jgi:hypothetical protein
MVDGDKSVKNYNYETMDPAKEAIKATYMEKDKSIFFF